MITPLASGGIAPGRNDARRGLSLTRGLGRGDGVAGSRGTIVPCISPPTRPAAGSSGSRVGLGPGAQIKLRRGIARGRRDNSPRSRQIETSESGRAFLAVRPDPAAQPFA